MQAIEKILFDQEAVAARVAELGGRISRDYEGKDLLMVCILKGALLFFSDLVRCIPYPVELGFVQAASYGASRVSCGQVRIEKDLDRDINNRHVLLVDTIIDTGETLHTLIRMLSEKKPASLSVAVLLDKISRRRADVPVAYRGFEIPDTFVAGYGMDCGERYRNLPHIVVIKPEDL